ncbi:Ubiquitin-60S ribosomal protein L40 [Orchesella cincta]|uniref:Ubiquitin-60S ribosomal protein L40 n=1 Tax=Orchesella cincta TaxID=48709 RepID=A0A1D2M7X6_ORCCI|nr:Ubiquitin-60S ribosomal protein L40 [Orchesella cincta]
MNISHFFLAVVYLTLLHTVFGNIKIAAESTFDNADNTAKVGKPQQHFPLPQLHFMTLQQQLQPPFENAELQLHLPQHSCISDPTTAASTTFRKRRTTAAIHDTTAASSDTTTAASTPFQKRRTTATIHDTTAASLTQQLQLHPCIKTAEPLLQNWTESKIECQKIGMELATITTTKELIFFVNITAKRPLLTASQTDCLIPSVFRHSFRPSLFLFLELGNFFFISFILLSRRTEGGEKTGVYRKAMDYTLGLGWKMQIFVKIIRGKVLSLDVNPADTIEILKATIKEMQGIPQSDQTLLFNQHSLENRNTLLNVA